MPAKAAAAGAFGSVAAAMDFSNMPAAVQSMLSMGQTVYNVSAGRFQKMAADIPLMPADIAGMMGGPGSAAPPKADSGARPGKRSSGKNKRQGCC